MFSRFLLILMVCILSRATYAQERDLVAQGTSPSLYITHSVAPKENWYSVGRLYNISPKEVAPYNGVTLDNPLSIGQQLKVPLTSSNFSQDASKADDEVFVPLYHIVQEKEWMYRISTNYNKVPIENLEKWNNVSKDQVKAGMKLVVGYLKVKRDQSALASKGTQEVKTGTAPSVGRAPDVAEKNEPVASTAENKQDRQPPPVEQTKPLPVDKKMTETGGVDAAAKQPVNTSAAQPEPGTRVAGGYFKSLYEQSGKATTGSAGIFKSTSGWQDGKYYALMNNVAVGTILAVSNPSNNKVVYAKVLGQLPDMKESNGLTIRISDAAASELEAGDSKFAVNIKY